MCDDESEAQKIKRLALGKIGEYLRNAGGLFNRIDTSSAQVTELKEVYEMHFNLIALFFPTSINVTTWTVGYAIPYHANLLFNQYKVGYGIVFLQAKEAKHSGVKEDLTLTNRSNVSSGVGKSGGRSCEVTMCVPFIYQNISPCPLFIPHTISHALLHTAISQMFANVAEIKMRRSFCVKYACLALRL